MKRILISAGSLVFIGALAVSATGAFFSDTETSTGNTFASGAIDLTIDSVAHYNGMVCTDVNDTYRWIPEGEVTYGPDFQPIVDTDMDEQIEWDVYNALPANATQFPQAGVECTGTWPLANLDGEGEGFVVGTFFDFDDIKPGDEGENTISIHIDSNDAWMCVDLENVAGADPVETATEPEDTEEDFLGDITHGATLADSELDENLFFFAWLDDGDNVYEPGDAIGTSTAVETAFGAPVAASTLSAQTWALADSTTGNGPIQGDQTGYIGVYWCAGTISVVGDVLSCDGEDMGNEAQTDSWSADLNFYVEQSRNNEDFVCNPDTLPEATTLTLEKVIQQDGVNVVTEALWTLTASSTNTMTMISGIETDPAVTAAPVPAGDYVLSESVVAGFTQSNLQCVGGNLVGNTVTVPLGANVVCTFTNTENAPQ